MIIARITGGLGNQLFQYAMGRATSARHHAPLLLDLSHYATSGGHAPRRFELDAFNVQYGVATEQERATFRSSRMRRLLDRTGLTTAPRVVHQNGFGFHPSALETAPPVYLDGTWQSEKYFASCSATLREEITLKQGSAGEGNAIATALRSVPSVSVHVRRGDYANDAKTRDYHGLLSMTYYEAAMRWMSERVPNANFFIFTDEPDWAREHFQSNAPVTVLPVRSGPEDLLMMAHCQHHIIANSSFSWWGAWLNPSHGKLVVAPQRWFADPDIDTNDLLPPTWARL